MRVAVITGGNRGIGRSTALEAAKRGIGVILTYNSHAEEAREVVEQVEAHGAKARALKLDVADIEAFSTFRSQVADALAKTWGRNGFDFCVNNAGVGQRARIEEIMPEQFDRLVDINFRGPFFLTQSLLPLIRDGGQIVNISSALARVTFPGVAVYAALKAALETMTRYQAAELAGRRIRVNCVAPGAIDTAFGGGKGDTAARQRIAGITALGRLGEPDEVGRFVAGLLDDDHPFMTAQRIELSGGIAL